MRPSLPRLAASAALLLSISSHAAPPGVRNPPAPAKKGTDFAVSKRFAPGGEGGWDYLVADGATGRLFVSRSTRVLVLEGATGKVLGEIPETEGVHGIALAPDLNRGFTSNGRSSTVSIFDLKTLAVLSKVKTTGENPDGILYEPVTKRVFTFNGRGKNATAFDASTGAVVGTIDLGGKPESAVSDAAGRIYVNVEDKNEIAVFDARKSAVDVRWPLAGCEEPTGLALDRKNGRLFVGCGNKVLAVVNLADGHVLATLPTGAGTDFAAFDPGLSLAFVSSGDGTLTIAREDPSGTFSVVQSVETQKGARTMALDEKTHRIYLPAARYGAPPSPTTERPNPRPVILPGSFEILVVEPKS